MGNLPRGWEASTHRAGSGLGDASFAKLGGGKEAREGLLLGADIKKKKEGRNNEIVI